MPSLKDLRNRIASVKATQKITKAMQMVAAAKLRRAQEAAEAARPYSERMGSVLANITQAIGGGGDAPALMTGTGKDDVHLLVVCTAERGLCGGFNSQIARLARDHIRKLLADGKQVKIICVGKKGFDILRRDYASMIIDRVDLREVKTLGFVNADAIAKKVIHLFNEGGFDICTLFYSQFKSVISQIPTAQQIIPAGVASAPAEAIDGGNAVYEYEPEPGEILSDLIPRNISVQVFRALLENVAGEMGAKMSAMDNATRNAGDMINKLSITYNRQRQAQITKELIEIISGAEAL
ncbi:MULTISPECIES: F0F1 ATP synthase subunit gamma [unclassified Mesorhizobium]|jgi:F-type H+-transporting ATPase subunit gamma|uniref:F0F1 ATP synthase subunit gamma n=2 Tax=Mesorhizobium TaxID=68287 RepID=UPI000FCBB3FF|nr:MULTISPECIES: F0F1 ATP synthase subunit gamma [unclassified Mesorhizobium]AZV19229.1 F0F1 ATP synthase subunit gamma [Mesorhizobium sp. M7A.F.Ce.TU.012.03.2.1]MBZ9776775.1 F0F1 ATP synthase subunit gamma [Mesorhizobium sp. CO1-1-8]MCQ8875506.1 F0F1 ATP synthase subunit gamma [Mesorhizobium sp. LMG17149]RUU82363.1 F0F1 ATP synthase subunit gamma [Mesorhizobium sp. M7A.F.Ca.MR.362.00.0.0]RUW57863.1 F0F1 ATP synthase subunit gamma [Mesorhizobium sp. M7A.F.Ca.US.008.03.1.1]